MIQIVVSGVVSSIAYSHTFKGMKFYSMKLHCKRLSGVVDVLPIVLSESTLATTTDGERILVCGNIMTRNTNEKLELYVYGQQVYEHKDASDVNVVIGTGFLVKKGDVRTTTKSNRTIMRFILASNNNHGSSYIPALAWSGFATALDKIEIGQELTVVGRLQSRDYDKFHEDGTSDKLTTYELSIKYAEQGGVSIA